MSRLYTVENRCSTVLLLVRDDRSVARQTILDDANQTRLGWHEVNRRSAALMIRNAAVSVGNHVTREDVLGSCALCGARYFAVRCAEWVQHIVAHHNEGGCPQWSDCACK
jgi:hypothetical protein